MKTIMATLILATATVTFAEDSGNSTQPAEVVDVEASRLVGNAIDADKIPQGTIVITRAEIERSAASTVAEVLAERPEIVAYDEVGNGKEAVVDIRGFNQGTAMAVFLDDVRINEPDDNRVLLSQIPLDWVDRIEIFKGSSSSVLGGGALSGAVRIYTNRRFDRSRVSLTGGSFTTGGLQADYRHALSSGTAWSLGAGTERSDGFRENGSEREGFFRVGTQHSSESSLFRVNYAYTKTKFGAPGALTADELAADRWQAPFNKVDKDEDATHLLSGDFRLSRGSVVFNGNVFYRQNLADALTTGRSAALYGGFATEGLNKSGGSTVQLSVPLFGEKATLATGTELSWVRLKADGFYTDVSGTQTGAASSTNTAENLQAGFVQVEVSPVSSLTLLAGTRYDRQVMHFLDNMSAYQAERTFEKATYRTGASIAWAAHATAYVNYSTAFQTPTILDLFAYPGFFSNPDLRPSLAHVLEVGQRISRGGLSAHIAVYRLKVEDEVIFVLTDPIRFIGQNQNAGQSSRRGFDVDLTYQPTQSMTLDAAYSFIRARFDVGDFKGDFLTMVPEHRFEAGMSRVVRHNLRFSGKLVYTGTQFVQGDELNALAALPAYWRVDVKARYAVRDWVIEAAVRNLLDRKYATRAITNGYDTYFTPAAGINGLVTIGYEF